MAAIHGRRTKVYVNGSDLTAYFRSANIQRTADMAESSAFQTDGKSYIPGMRDGTISAEGLFDGSALAIDVTLSAILGSETQAVVLIPIGVEALGSVAHGLSATDNTHDVEASTDDIATINAEFQSSTGVERTLIHAVLTAVTVGANGASIDNAASTTSGGSAYLQVTAQSGGGTLTVKVQHSVDNSVWADLITFTGTTALGAQRATVTGTVNRYTRAVHAITAGSATYVMAFGRNTYS